MKTSKLLLCASVVASGLFTAPSFAATPSSTSGLTGTWHNVNPSSRGIIKVVVTKVGAQLRFKSYGACSPTPCIHTTVMAHPHSSSVSSNFARGFTAYRNSGFKTTRFDAIRDYGQTSGSFLRLNSFSKFAPGDNRKNYLSSELFRK
jgi:hypothetical protein